jgi:hypothetical protein
MVAPGEVVGTGGCGGPGNPVGLTAAFDDDSVDDVEVRKLARLDGADAIGVPVCGGAVLLHRRGVGPDVDEVTTRSRDAVFIKTGVDGKIVWHRGHPSRRRSRASTTRNLRRFAGSER